VAARSKVGTPRHSLEVVARPWRYAIVREMQPMCCIFALRSRVCPFRAGSYFEEHE